MMTEEQKEMWYALCELSGEDVARAFTYYYGNKLLNDDFAEWLKEEGYMEGDENED